MERNTRILLGVDASLSPATQQALRVTGERLALIWQDVCAVLLHVIPVPYDPSYSRGKFLGDLHLFSPTSQQRLQAEHVLWRARTALLQQGIVPGRIQWLQRVGTPADEIVKAARELAVDSIVIGSRGNTLAQRVRRLLMGSTSRRVLRLAPCPVKLVVPPGTPGTRNLVIWYKESVMSYLHAHPGSLEVFTACDVAQMFAPEKRTVGSKEVDAASRALNQLAGDGILCCAPVKGELRYFND
jgi:nucleotide-binding universal stress UspA family protein